MRSKMLWVLRHLIISAGLVWATGIPQGIVRTIVEADNRKPYVEYLDGTFARFTEKDFALLEINPQNFLKYTDSLKKNRQLLALHDQYSLSLYFKDLAQYRMFEVKFYDELNKTQQGKFILGSIQFGTINTLQGFSMQQKSFSIADPTMADVRDKWLHDKRDPNAPEFCWMTDIIKPVVSWLLIWFVKLYLHGFPFALVLFLIWKFNLKREFDDASYRETLNVKHAPVSFGLSLLLWPLVLWIDIRNRWKREMARTEVLSRRDNMLSVFSKQEEQLLQLSKKMGVREFREHLDSLGMTRKHSIAAAWCVTIFLIVVPTCLFPHSTTPLKKDVTIMKKVDYGGGGIQKFVQQIEKAQAILFDEIVFIVEQVRQVFFITHWLYENDFSPDIGKVPLVVNHVTYVSD
jgi:hypothetical protein